MSDKVGHCLCRDTLTYWEIWSNGRAYSDNHGSVCYRHEDGSWRDRLISRGSHVVDVTEKLESIFQKYLSSLIVGPLDPRARRK